LWGVNNVQIVITINGTKLSSELVFEHRIGKKIKLRIGESTSQSPSTTISLCVVMSFIVGFFFDYSVSKARRF
jgi:hypothetical protein